MTSATITTIQGEEVNLPIANRAQERQIVGFIRKLYKGDLIIPDENGHIAILFDGDIVVGYVDA